MGHMQGHRRAPWRPFHRSNTAPTSPPRSPRNACARYLVFGMGMHAPLMKFFPLPQNNVFSNALVLTRHTGIYICYSNLPPSPATNIEDATSTPLTKWNPIVSQRIPPSPMIQGRHIHLPHHGSNLKTRKTMFYLVQPLYTSPFLSINRFLTRTKFRYQNQTYKKRSRTCTGSSRLLELY